MAELNATDPKGPSLEALQNRSRDMRRARPPDVTILRSENKVPLRPERLAKRESRIGLRNIFSKSKPAKDDKIAEEMLSTRESSKYGGIRNSIVDIGNWSHRIQASRSEVSLPTSPPSTARSSTVISPSLSYQSRQNSNGASKGKSRQPVAPKTRGSIPTFNPPPLFQMYPQAIKHVRLPTCITPIDTLARLSESKSSSLQDNFSRSDLALDQGGASGLERKGEGGKKRKAKFTPEWASKIYALVTSGYLLQYAAEGTFDRLPEKILHLTQDSAAYVTDLIPGKPWVIRVASSTDVDGNPSSDTKSLRSKFALRGIEKKQVSNMLLVFQNPDTMDTWLAILRHKIELLGGRKKLSETGKPEVDEDIAVLKTQASQRTLVVRDPGRFSHIITQDFSWTQENALVDPYEESDMAEARFERMSGSTMGDGSSMVSTDGQCLDSLRDSGSGSGSGSSDNRLSFISSGQRTIVSSAESSPTTSPIRASFSSYGDDHQDLSNQPALPPLPEVRPRPNAAAIVNRRQSMQTTIPPFDHPLNPVSRSPPLPPATLPSGHDTRQQFVPNFSVPHTVSRRYSAMNLPTSTPRAEGLRVLDQDGPIRPFRRSPPTTLAISRPLSIVLDQPSPITPSMPSIPSIRGPTLKAPDTPSMFGPWGDSSPNLRPQEKTDIPRSFLSRHMTEEPRLGTSATNVWSQGQFDAHAIQQDMSLLRLDPDKSYIVRPARARPVVSPDIQEPIRRASSSLEMRRVSTTPIFRQPSYKRSTSSTDMPASQSRHSMIYSGQSNVPCIEEPDYILSPPHIFSPKRSVPSLKALQQEVASNQHLAVDFGAKALSTRRSMPTLAEGPPPAPPPTCALPPLPLPRKRSTNIPRTIKT
ncbi:hypothetical protein F4820DRAFT_203779 [Hypoxylon rubiginosum]|uniref:Uncharacterized protein n=1 Tax=Hypoxylon rubiginosum TaxID=110542 RepID=A0ACB9Z6S7_9PEZI|nr:hypothetical protein F4820DRAFT_203779 [Hypoxylon rubiginosum]